MSLAQRPCVLVLAGLDPSGGAGLAADISAINAQGAHALPVLTVLTVQDNNRVHAVTPLPAAQVLAQARALLAAIPIHAIKCGIIGSLENAQAIAALIREVRRQQPDLPFVLDPVLASGHGDKLAADDPCAIVYTLLPLASIILPNLPEAARLCPQAQNAEQQAVQLQTMGCPQVLLKGGHGNGKEVINTWYHPAGEESWEWPRLAGEFHGSGCTLAASLAAQLALGHSMRNALAAAQEYTQRSLARAYAIAPGQLMPGRTEFLENL